MPMTMPNKEKHPMNDPLPAGEPPESLADLAREHPGLVLAGGLAVGLLVGALIPRRKGGQLLRNAASLAAVAGELALALGEQTREKAEDARERIVDLSHKAGDAGRRATHAGLEKGDEAREAGLRLARKAVRAVARRLD